MNTKDANVGICPLNGEIHLIIEPLDDDSPGELLGIISPEQARSMAELLKWAANVVESGDSDSVSH